MPNIAANNVRGEGSTFRRGSGEIILGTPQRVCNICIGIGMKETCKAFDAWK